MSHDIDTWGGVPGIQQGCTLGPHSLPIFILKTILSTSSSKIIHTGDSSTVLVKPGFVPELSIQISNVLL